MKILVVCQYYYPEPFRITDICEELVRRGHEVLVVTGTPNYPAGEIYSGYERGRKRDEIINGVRVHRCPLIPRKTGAFFRLLNYFSFPLTSRCYVRSKACAPADGGVFDVVFVNQLSPVMMAEAGIAYKKKHGVPVVLYCLDLWPASLAAGHVKTTSWIYKAFHKISSHVYRSVDRILVTSKMFEDYLRAEFGISGDKVEYLPQYAENVFTYIEPRKPDGKINLVFAGNLGTAQSLDTVLDAAAKIPEVSFHIIGDGVELERLRQKAGDNVIFYGRKPLEDMPAYYAMADAMLVTLQADPVLSLTLPGKVQSYMAVGRPIIGAIDGEAQRVIEKSACGFCGPAEDSGALVENIRRFVACEQKKELGQNARQYYKRYFMRKGYMDGLERMISFE